MEVHNDELYYKGAMPGSSTPSITLSRFGEVMQHQFINRVPRSACERD